jgi:uncharacterized protein with FMN-binding domain
MRRAPFVGVATVAGLIGVLSFHTKSLSASLATPSTTTPPRSASQGTTPSTTTPATGHSSGGSPSSATGGSTPAAKAPSTTTTTPPTTATATGTLEQYGYGELNVKVTVSGGRIRDVTVPKLLVAEQYSQQLAQSVIPMLRSEVLKAQSANISGVSGATYTSEAYALSLQAALKQLHFA